MDLNYLDLDWRRLLVKHYKYYGIDENGLSLIFCISDILSNVDILVTADDLVSYMTLPKADIDALLVTLMDKGLIEYVSIAGKTVTSLRPLYGRIVSDLTKDIVIDSKDNNKMKVNKIVGNLYTYFEDEMGRTITGRELDRIAALIRSGADERMIKEAVAKLKAKNKPISIAAVDKIVLSLQKSSDISEEGFSSRKDDYREGSKETLDILSKPWVPKE
jgi:DNA replication protein DnaD